MAKIGTFTQDGKTLVGKLITLTLNADLVFNPIKKASEKSPDFRVYAGIAEIGAAWKKTSKEDNAYLSVTLDDPSFAAPVYASLLAGNDGEHNLIWNR